MAISKVEREFHRKFAVRCFNLTWDYLELKKRTIEDDRQMLYLAHASRYHWGIVGTPRNRAIGDWQISRVYAELRHLELALEFARSCLATCEKNNLSDIVHTANEAIARAYAVAKDYRSARSYLNKARQQFHNLRLDKEDEKIYSDQLHDTELFIEKERKHFSRSAERIKKMDHISADD